MLFNLSFLTFRADPPTNWARERLKKLSKSFFWQKKSSGRKIYFETARG
jgi:hypothetical protein